MGDTIFTLQQDHADKQRNRTNLIISAVVLIALFIATTFIFPGEDTSKMFIWEEDHLLITKPDETTETIPYADILNMTLVENFDFGTCLDGKNENRYRFGTWSNDSLGQYRLCATGRFESVILMTTPDGYYAIGYESGKTTAGLYPAFLDLLADEGYSPATEPIN